MRKLIVLGVVVCMAVLGAAAGVEPLARWAGDFGVAEKNGFTLDPRGNAVAADGSAITIGAGATSGVAVDYPKEKGTVTVAVRYGGFFPRAGGGQALLTFRGGGTSGSTGPHANRMGVLVNGSAQACPVWQGALWYHAQTGLPVAYPLTEEGCFAMCYSPQVRPGFSDRGGVLYAARRSGAWGQLAVWGNVMGADEGNVTGFSVGGPRAEDNAGLTVQAGLEIREIAVYPGRLTAEQLNESFNTADRPRPVVRFAADEGVTTDPLSGDVTGWANSGTLGSAVDLAAVGTGIKIRRAAFGEAPAVRLPGSTDMNGYLEASAEHALGLTRAAGATVFLVYRPLNVWAPWGLRTSTQDRCFSDMANGSFRFFWFFQTGATMMGDVAFDEPKLRTMTVAGGDELLARVFSGGTLRSMSRNVGTPKPGVLTIGHPGHSSGGTYTMEGEIAELRIYNEELSAAERFRTDCELAAKYALAVDPDGLSPCPGALLGGFMHDAAVLGTLTAGAQYGVGTEATSAGLSIAFARSPAADSEHAVYVAHDGSADETTRAWVVAGAAGARAMPLTLAFSGAAYAGRDRLYYRADADHAWDALTLPSMVVDGTVAFTLPEGWSNGQYCLRPAKPVPALWFTADDAVTDVDGHVVRLPNRGTLAHEVAQLVPTNMPGVGSVMKKTDAALFGGRPHLAFERGHLVSEVETDLGFGGDVPGAALFIVLHVTDLSKAADQRVCGLYSGDNAKRCAVFFADSGSKVLRSHLFGTTTLDVPATAFTTSCALLSVNGYVDGTSKTGSARVNGGTPAVARNWWTLAPWKGVFMLGSDAMKWSDDYPGMTGEIAEFRLYTRPLTVPERAAVELELAAKYDLGVTTAGAVDNAALAAHGADLQVVGRDPNAAVSSTAVSSYSDGVLTFSLAVEPDAGARSLAVVASDGADAAFASPAGNASVQRIPRTWYVAGALPGAGGIFDFSCDTADGAKWTYRLCLKRAGAADYARLGLVPAVEDGHVVFTCAELEAGTYRLERRRTDLGSVLIVR